jgi:hypothetical protein
MSEALRLWLHRCNNAKPTRCYNSFLQVQSVTTVSYKYSLTAARHATVVVAVTSTVHYPANYKIKMLFQMKFEDVNKLTLIIYYLDRRLVWLWWGMLMPIGMPC